ncbi:MAG: signal recognition particle receptor subunit alpha, partial [Desulfurococcaceae archaeon]
MFTKLRDVFKKFIDTTSSLLTSKEKLIESVEEFKLGLISRDVAFEVAEDISSKLIELIENKAIRDKKQLVKTLREIILSYFNEAGSININELVKSRKPYKIMFMGVNGVGKTTTIAKVAVYLRKNGYKPLMVAADTFRAAAQEQLKKHSERTQIPIFMGK